MVADHECACFGRMLAPLWAKVVQMDRIVLGKHRNVLIRLYAVEVLEQQHGSESTEIYLTSAAAVKTVRHKVPRFSRHQCITAGSLAWVR